MVVLKAIGSFFAKIGRWIKETAWVQPLLIVGAIFGIIFAIPKIVDAVKDANSDSNAAQTFFEKNEISSQGKENKLSEDSQLDKFLTILEDKESDADEVYKNLNSLLGLNSKQFFLIFVDSTNVCDPLFNGFNYLKNNWKNDEFKDGVGDSKFTYRTIYVDKIDKYDDKTNLWNDVYSRHLGLVEQMASELSYTQFAQNKNYTEGYYDKLVAEDGSGFYQGTVIYFDFTKDAYENVATPGLRTFMTSGDVGGATAYNKAQNLYSCWIEQEGTEWGINYEK